MRSPCTDAAIAELRAAGVYDYELVRGGKHWQVQWALKDGARRFYVLPGTPSDWRSARNVRADIRRLLKADGLILAADPAGGATTTAVADPCATTRSAGADCRCPGGEGRWLSLTNPKIAWSQVVSDYEQG